MTRRFIRSAAGPCLLLVLVSLGTLFFRLGQLPFIGADEPRYARIAEEMSSAGRWVTPLLEGYPWLEKPPLYYWLTIPCYRIFGAGETIARLAPALCALLAAACVFWLGSRLWSRPAGVLGGLVLLTSIGFCGFGRSASPDMPFTVCLTAALSLLAVAVIKGDLAWWRTLCAYVFLGLAVLAKGPVALALGAGILVLFWVADEQGGSLGRMRVAAGTAVAAAVAIPWFWLAFRENGFAFVSIFFINHNLARYVSDIHHHEQPFYYFVPVILGLFFPWSGWLPVLVPRSVRSSLGAWRTWDRGAVFLGVWTLFPLLFFSLSTSKLPGYVLPSLPPLALLLGRRLAGFLEKPDRSGAFRITRWIALALSLGVAIAAPLVLDENHGLEWRRTLPLSAAVLAPALFVFLFLLRGQLRRAVTATLIQGVVLVLAVTQFGFPLLARSQSTREIARQALDADRSGEPIVTYHFFHHTLHYYTGYRVAANVVDPASLTELARRHGSLLVVTEDGWVRELESTPGLAIAQIGVQGKFRLLRVTATSD